VVLLNYLTSIITTKEALFGRKAYRRAVLIVSMLLKSEVKLYVVTTHRPLIAEGFFSQISPKFTLNNMIYYKQLYGTFINLVKGAKNIPKNMLKNFYKKNTKF